MNETTQDTSARFEVVAFELWGNSRDGFDTNSAWYLSKNADADQVLQDARGRWEAFKVNYAPKARVCDIEATGFDSTLYLEVNSIPFLEIRLA